MREIRLYGILAKKFGKSFHLEVATAAEAVTALGTVVPGFKEFMCREKIYYQVVVGDLEIGLQELNFPSSDQEIIRIIPVLSGSLGNFFKIVLGITLMIFAPELVGMIGMIGEAAWMTGAMASFGLSLVGNVGLALVLSGVSGLLAPKPPPTPVSTASYNFTGAINNTVQGGPVPILYGRLVVGSETLSVTLSTVQV